MKFSFFNPKPTKKIYETTDIVVIGGGATGLGVARDAALRGFKVVLVERGELGSGTSSRFHGFLHSGARYAVDDADTARECYQENLILRRIAPSAVEETGGFFVALSDDEARYGDALLAACAHAGIPVADVPLAEARKHEPILASTLITRTIAVPDATVDGAELLKLNRQAAETAAVPATILTGYKAVKMRRKDGHIVSVVLRNMHTGKRRVIKCSYVVNAGGIWAGQIGKLAGARINMIMDKGVMVTLDKRLSHAVLNRCRPATDGDILVPQGEYCAIGTTSTRTRKLENPKPTQAEIDQMMQAGEQLAPGLLTTPIKRAYAGIRPLFAGNATFTDPWLKTDRAIGRSFAVLDHQADTGVDNFISVVGGKVTVYRRMAEAAVDLICKKQGIARPCSTAEVVMHPQGTQAE